MSIRKSPQKQNGQGLKSPKSQHAKPYSTHTTSSSHTSSHHTGHGRHSSGNSAASAALNKKKFYLLITLELVCLVGLVKFFSMGVGNIFTFLDFWESLMKVLGYAVVFSVLQISFKTLARPVLSLLLPKLSSKHALSHYSKSSKPTSHSRVDRTAVSLFKLSYNVIIWYCWQKTLEAEIDGGALWPNAIPSVGEYISPMIPDVVREKLTVTAESGYVPGLGFIMKGLETSRSSSTGSTVGITDSYGSTNSSKNLSGFLSLGRSEKQANISEIWDSNVKVSEGTRSLFLLIIGYLTSELILLLYDFSHRQSRSDYYEMLLHHSIASVITFFTYLCDFLCIGVMVMYVHNASDVFIYISRSTIDMQNKFVIGGCFCFLCTAFFWYRLLVFPLCLLRSCWIDSYPYMLHKFKVAEMQTTGNTNVDEAYATSQAESHATISWLYFNSTLSILYVLNAYWFLLILRVGSTFFSTGKTKDVAIIPGEETGQETSTGNNTGGQMSGSTSGRGGGGGSSMSSAKINSMANRANNMSTMSNNCHGNSTHFGSIHDHLSSPMDDGATTVSPVDSLCSDGALSSDGVSDHLIMKPSVLLDNHTESGDGARKRKSGTR